MIQLITLHSASWFPWLLDILLKSVVLLALAGIAVLACWRASAAQRHLIWTLAVVGVLLLPVLSATLPAWHVLRWQQSATTLQQMRTPAPVTASPMAVPVIVGEPTLPSREPLIRPTPSTTTSASPTMASTGEQTVASSRTSAPTSAPPSRPPVPWSVWIMLAWGIGTALVLAWTLFGYILAHRLRRRVRPAPAVWASEMPAGVRILVSDAIAMPMVAGLLCPTILLPAQAEEWPEDRRRVVLLHELAHIQRRDLLVHLLTQLACACYWMNPLVWVAAYRMRVERETACDDVVLGTNVRASDYAAHLLAVASVLQGRRFAPAVGIAMARTSKVGKRIKGVLDGNRNRRGISKWMLAVTVVCMLLILMTITSAQETGGIPDEPQPSQTLATQTPNVADASELLAAAKTEMVPLPQRLMTTVKDQLTAQVIIQEASADPGQAMVQASRLREPFYASLAMGGVTAVQLQQRSPEAAANYRKAVERARTIKHHIGSDPTSLHFLFMLVPYFPGERAREMLTYSRQHCMAPYAADDTDDVINRYPLLALARATVAVEPAAAHDLLFSVAVKSNHYWASSEYLATYLAEQDLVGTLKAAEDSYKTDFGGSSESALSAALFVLARTDLNRALAEIWRMREPDDEVAALTLAQQLLAAGKKEEARQVVADVERRRGNPSLEWTGRTLRELRQQLAANTAPATQTIVISQEMVDDFLARPAAETLERFSTQHQVVFRDKEQAARFVTAALPLAATLARAGLKDFGGGGPDQSAYGFLVSCAAIAGDIRQALEIAQKVTMPEMRAAYLLEAYAALKPLPPPVTDWPIHLVHPSTVSLADTD